MSPQLWAVAVKLQKTFTSRCQRKCFGIPATKPLVHTTDGPVFLSSAPRYEDAMTEITLHVWLILRFKTMYQRTHVLSPQSLTSTFILKHSRADAATDDVACWSDRSSNCTNSPSHTPSPDACRLVGPTFTAHTMPRSCF